MAAERNVLPMKIAEADKSNDSHSKEKSHHSETENESTGHHYDLSNRLKKKKKRGIIYLSTIPKYMNVIKIRETFATYGKVGRVYLQLADAGKNYNNF